MPDHSDIGAETLRRMRAVTRYNAWIHERIRPWLGHRILEVGAGIGNFSSFFLDRPKVILSDVREEYLAILRDTYGARPNVTVIRYDLDCDADHLRDAAIDTVVCLNVLEHIEDDRRALREFARLLVPGGRVILQVPAHPFLYGTLDRNLDHFRRYTARGIREKFAAAGLGTAHLELMNLPGAVGWFLNARILRRDLLSEGSLGLFNRLMPLFAAAERIVPPPAGLSIIAVGEKPR